MKLSDVTLREADQMPGRDYAADEKIEAGYALDRLDLPFVQPAFPATGEKDRRVVRELASSVDADIVGLARALEGDVDAAVDAEADVVDVFAPISEGHLRHTLGESRSEMLSMLRDAIDHALDHGLGVHVTLADAFRADRDRVADVFGRFPDVEYVNLADTVGARTPLTVRSYLQELSDDVDLLRAGVHFHDDMGCATANALTAHDVGVGKADVSVASLGERAGNSSLEEVVVASAVDADDSLGVAESEVVPICREVLETLGEGWSGRKAVLGEEVTEHESGIHTAAMLDEPTVFEAYPPDRFGGERRLVFGANTGRGGARKLLKRASVDATDGTVDAFLDELADEGPMGLDEALALAERRAD